MVKEYRYYTYKITFKDLPGYFYYGRKKDNGKPYFGSPKTWRHLWDQFEPEIQILQWYKTEKEVQKAEDALIGHTWKQRWNGRRYSLNRNHGGHIDEERCSEIGKIGGITTFNKKKGLFDLTNKEKVREGNKKGGTKAGNKVGPENKEKGRGWFNPANKEKIKEGGRKGGNTRGKQLNRPVVCKETGIVYQSTKEAKRKTGNRGNISRSARSNGVDIADGFHWLYI